MTWYTSTGTLIYNPPRPENLKRGNDWWAVCTIDKEIVRLARWYLTKKYWLNLNPPSFGAHLSVIRGEKPADDLVHLWRKYHGQTFEFMYDMNIYQASKPGYWCIDVQSKSLMDVRREFNFKTNWPLHITIGVEK